MSGSVMSLQFVLPTSFHPIPCLNCFQKYNRLETNIHFINCMSSHYLSLCVCIKCKCIIYSKSHQIILYSYLRKLLCRLFFSITQNREFKSFISMTLHLLIRQFMNWEKSGFILPGGDNFPCGKLTFSRSSPLFPLQTNRSVWHCRGPTR